MADANPPESTGSFPRIGTRGLPAEGLPNDSWRDAYHYLLTMPLWAFFAIMAVAFVAINAVFALLYLLDPVGLSGARPGSFSDAFFFSVQTLGTLGYGVMALGRSTKMSWSRPRCSPAEQPRCRHRPAVRPHFQANRANHVFRPGRHHAVRRPAHP